MNGNQISFTDMKMPETLLGPVLVTQAETKTSAAGKRYSFFTICDGTTSVDARYFEKTVEEIPFLTKIPSVMTVRITKQLYNGGPSYLINEVFEAPADVNIRDFVVRSEFDPEEMYGKISKYVHSVAEEGDVLAEIFDRIWEEQKEKLLYWGAAKAVHHNFYAGLLQHTLEVVYNAYSAIKIIKDIDKSAVIVGAALHDIGKLEELSTNALGVSEYTMEGRLLGHLYLGCEMVDRIVMKDPEHFLGEEKRLRILNLKHIIACHHSEREWGAIQLPATPECLVVCKADQMSADLEQARKALAGKKAGEESDKVFGLGNIPLYKLY